MSSASKTVHIKFLSKLGTYTPLIQSPSGDLYQEYQQVGDQVVTYPDFSKTKPELYFICTSSRAVEGAVTPVSMRYYFNDSEITFASSGVSDGLFAGMFEIIRPSTNQPYFGLRIVKNLAEASRFASIVIKMVGKITARGQQSDLTDDIQETYTISVSPYTGTVYRVTIMAGDSKMFTLQSPTDSCVLKAKTTQGNETLSSGLYYKWYRAANTASGWEQISGASSATITVKATDVNCTREFMVEVYNSSSMSKDSMLGFDFQTVIDTSDPYEIEPHPSPSDGSIDEDTSGNGSVTYTPKLVTRGTSNVVASKFFFTLKSQSGVVLNTEASRNNTKALSSFTVTRQDCINGGYGDIGLTIDSEK